MRNNSSTGIELVRCLRGNLFLLIRLSVNLTFLAGGLAFTGDVNGGLGLPRRRLPARALAMKSASVKADCSYQMLHL